MGLGIFGLVVGGFSELPRSSHSKMTYFCFSTKMLAINARSQGDQIWRIFASWVIVYFGQFCEVSETCTRKKWRIQFRKQWVGLHFGRFFTQTHLVTLFCSKLSLNVLIFRSLHEKSRVQKKLECQKIEKKEKCIRVDCQGCQMVCFQTKNPNWGKFRRALE
jgi:hypothetical protein